MGVDLEAELEREGEEWTMYHCWLGSGRGVGCHLIAMDGIAVLC